MKRSETCWGKIIRTDNHYDRWGKSEFPWGNMYPQTKLNLVGEAIIEKSKTA